MCWASCPKTQHRNLRSRCPSDPASIGPGCQSPVQKWAPSKVCSLQSPGCWSQDRAAGRSCTLWCSLGLLRWPQRLWWIQNRKTPCRTDSAAESQDHGVVALKRLSSNGYAFSLSLQVRLNVTRLKVTFSREQSHMFFAKKK